MIADCNAAPTATVSTLMRCALASFLRLEHLDLRNRLHDRGLRHSKPFLEPIQEVRIQEQWSGLVNIGEDALDEWNKRRVRRSRTIYISLIARQ
jgi:hypothetical protein